MKEKGKYTQKRRRETADKTESESEIDEDPLGLVQPSDRQDSSYRPYQGTARRKVGGTAYHKTRGRWIEPTSGTDRRLEKRGEVDALPNCFIKTNPERRSQSTPSRRMRLSFIPAAVLFLLWLVVSAGAAPLAPQHQITLSAVQ